MNVNFENRTPVVINTPLQRVVGGGDGVETVSTVSTGCGKPFKRFSLRAALFTPLKRGANERGDEMARLASGFGLRPFWRMALASLAGFFLVLPSAFACSACYGEPDSPMSRGLTWAIVALVGAVSFVLTGVTCFFVHVNRRASALEQAAQDSESANLRS